MNRDVRCKLFCHRVCRSCRVMMLPFGVINVEREDDRKATTADRVSTTTKTANCERRHVIV